MPSASAQRQISDQDVERALSGLDIPACPAIVTEVLAEAQKEMPDLRVLGRSIGSDVGMSALALKLANSPLFRAASPAVNVSQALARLGTRNVVCVVVAAALRQSVRGLPAAQLEAFWTRAGTVAVAASLIGRRHYGIHPDAAYAYGLFHDAAIPILMRRFPDYHTVADEARRSGRPHVAVEEARYETNHALVGSLLVRSWGLPAAIGQGIRVHHDEDVYELPDETLSREALGLVAVTHVAEYLACEALGESDEGAEPLFAGALRHLGVADADLADYRDDLQAAIDGSVR